jgi:hypothetical protein
MELRGTSGQLTVGIAALMARPFGRLGGAAGLDAGLVSRMQRAPLGQQALNAATRDALDLGALDFSDTFLRALGTDARARLAAEFLLAAPNAQQRIILRLAAAIEQERVRNTVLRRDRLRLQACLGEDALTFGLRRAPAFAAELAALSVPNFALPDLSDPQQALPPAQNPFFAAGRGLMLDLLKTVEPALGVLAGHMLPSGPDAPAVSPDAAQTAAAWRIIERGLST